MNRLPFGERVRLAQLRTGKSYHQICREMGSAGGRRAAENKRLRRLQAERARMANRRFQEVA